MNKIEILSDDLINKIAAGEVIERPASAVKELVENSIDANSKKIDIYIKNAGKSEITVNLRRQLLDIQHQRLILIY